MLDPKDIAAKSLDLRQQLDAKLGVKGRDLPQALRRAGHRLPRRVRAKAAIFAAAEQRVGHPKLARQIDGPAVRAAFGEVSAHLRAIDAVDARRGRILGLAGVVAFNVLLILGAFVTWMWWRGYV